MSVLKRSEQRTKAVRLVDVPLTMRRRGASLAIAQEDDPVERLRIKMLAEFPPRNLVFWIRP